MDVMADSLDDRGLSSMHLHSSSPIFVSSSFLSRVPASPGSDVMA